jgi:hypothetical protein
MPEHARVTCDCGMLINRPVSIIRRNSAQPSLSLKLISHFSV